MSIIKKMLPKGLLWRLTWLNIVVIATAIALSGWAVYNTACFLAEGMGVMDAGRQRLFNGTLFNYLWIFSLIFIGAGTILHYYLTKKLIKPIHDLIKSTKKMKNGEYPEPIVRYSQDEMGQLIQQYNELIQQLQKNEQDREKLVSDLSHEFRTPLANLNGYLHALQTGVMKGDESLFRSLFLESNRLTQMLEQLERLKEWDYTVSQPNSNKQWLNISDTISQCVAMFEWALKQSNIELSVEMEASTLLVNKSGIQQVVSNLLDNAILYYEGKGPIVIKGEPDGENYRVMVSGPSKVIPKGEQANIFNRFVRVDESRSRETGGTGLGLAIAKEIVESHGGEIGMAAKEDRNSFWFSLPSG